MLALLEGRQHRTAWAAGGARGGPPFYSLGVWRSKGPTRRVSLRGVAKAQSSRAGLSMASPSLGLSTGRHAWPKSSKLLLEPSF